MSLISRDITKRRLISLSVLLTSVMLGCGSDSQQRVDPSQSQVPNQQGGIINPTNVHMPTQAILSPTSTPINHPLILEFTPAPINNPDLEQTPDPTLPYVPKLPADEFPALVQFLLRTQEDLLTDSCLELVYAENLMSVPLI